MDDKNIFALVPRPPSAIEKSQPGAKRILSGMVADTLAMAKRDSPVRSRPLRIVMMDDEPFVGEAMKMMLQFDLPNAEILTFTDVEATLEELARKDPDLFTTDWNHPRIKGDEVLRILAAKKVKYPILVISAYPELLHQNGGLDEFVDQGLNVSFIGKPFLLENIRPYLSKYLGLDYGRV